MKAETITKDDISGVLSKVVSAFPQEWRGTTFNNSNLLGRKGFVQNFTELVKRKRKDGSDIATSDLVNVGNAEDYLRVATNISTLHELVEAVESELNVEQVFTFASRTMGVVAVALSVENKPVHVYSGTNAHIFTSEQLEMLKKVEINVSCFSGTPPTNDEDNAVILVDESVVAQKRNNAHGVLAPNLLYVLDAVSIPLSKVFIIRKRMATPVTTPMGEAALQKLAGIDVVANTESADETSLTEFYSHLQILAGTEPNPDALPVVCQAGLPALNAFFTALISRGGADILMSSTAYGGCSQLTDIQNNRLSTFNKHTFDIQGIDTNIGDRIQLKLDDMARDPSKLLPVTVLFVEIPTNPDMKVPDLKRIAQALASYKNKTGKGVLLLVDTTFAPNSKVMAKAKEVAPDLNVMVFTSLSKSVSRGKTTGGIIVANHTEESIAIIKAVHFAANTFDTTSRKDQLFVLANNHKGVEDRCIKAYEIARDAGKALQDAVLEKTSFNMPLAFVSPESAQNGFTSSTFSFNLPPLKQGDEDANAALAQRFVDLLTIHPEFKPCVSFGQDNELVYCTVPATSTQGAIKAEDKAKQAVGGVQLTRLSFPPSVDTKRVQKVLQDAVTTIYSS